EENVWKLCEQVKKTRIEELSKCYAVFVSNEGRTVPLWRQKAGRGDDQVVIWDYHVFFMHNPSPNRCLVFDLDTTLPFPTYFHKYVTETFRSDLALRQEHHRSKTYEKARWQLDKATTPISPYNHVLSERKKIVSNNESIYHHHNFKESRTNLSKLIVLRPQHNDSFIEEQTTYLAKKEEN
ncbi:hypothetical protein DOY81_013245, partial [Sarcophaga bullata]